MPGGCDGTAGAAPALMPCTTGRATAAADMEGTMNRTFLAPIAGALLLAGLPLAAQDAQEPRGAELFEATCAGCHGPQSALTGATMGELEPEEFAQALSGHPDVGGLADLSEDDRRAIYVHLAEM